MLKAHDRDKRYIDAIPCQFEHYGEAPPLFVRVTETDGGPNLADLTSITPWIRRKIPKVLKDRIRSPNSAPVFDIGKPTHIDYSTEAKEPRLALLSYVTGPFKLPHGDPINVRFSNAGIARNIVRALNELGYIVDVVEWTDVDFVPVKDYDLFIGHGGWNYGHIARRLPGETTKIYFSTGLYWREHNRLEEERFRCLENRRQVRLPYDRWITHNEEYANRVADGIICLGDQVAKQSYSAFPLVINLNNAAYHDDRYDRTRKNFAAGGAKFLFFSGGGNVHKGLDLLLEAFVKVSAHLYICQEIRPNFHEIYRHELEDYPNIHWLGFVPLRSRKFYELVDMCNFAIYPSCADGCAGSLVECMHQGLIPVTSREATVDVDGYGILLKRCSVDEIVTVVKDLSQRPPEWCEEMSRKTRRAALADFSESKFLQNMRAAIEFVVSRKATENDANAAKAS